MRSGPSTERTLHNPLRGYGAPTNVHPRRHRRCKCSGPTPFSSPCPITRDSPDESHTGINVRVFPAHLQDRREVLTATSTSGNPNAWSGSDLAIFPGIWTHSFCRLLLNA